MKNVLLQISLVLLFLSGTVAVANAQILQSNPWKEDQLIAPAALADLIGSKSKIKIYNIGVVQNIKGAIDMGAASESENLERLKDALKNTPKDEAIVIYCGCCPMGKCPNIRPAFKMFQEQKFSNVRLLNLPVNIKVDWMDKGYPIE